MKLSIVTMTPEWAASIINNQNTSNRKMRANVVAHYANAIKSGQWKLTQQGIAISSEGVLLDGQHRLAAIVMADMPVRLSMATDCDPSIFAVLDTGTARTASDLLQINGVTDPSSVAAGIKQYILYNRHPKVTWGGANKPTHLDILNVCENRQSDVQFAAKLSMATYIDFRKLRKSGLVAFLMLAIDCGHSRESLAVFFEKLGSGAGLSSFSAVLRLRTALMNDACRGQKSNTSGDAQVFLAALIKAFNYDKTGNELKLFRMPQVPPMPTIINPF